jgi:hypothetical protein
MRTSTIWLFSLTLVIVAVVLAGCASEKNGCPSGKVWYRPDTSIEQTRLDLAICQHEALVYGRSYAPIPADSAGRAIALGLIASAAESSRENKLIASGMIAKGYSLVDASKAKSSNATAANEASNHHAENDLLGRWQMVAHKGNQHGAWADEAGFNFLSGNKFAAQSTLHGKTDSYSGTYSVRGSALILVCSQDPRPDTFGYSIVGDHLVMKHDGEDIIFKKADVSNTSSSQIQILKREMFFASKEMECWQQALEACKSGKAFKQIVGFDTATDEPVFGGSEIQPSAEVESKIRANIETCSRVKEQKEQQLRKLTNSSP